MPLDLAAAQLLFPIALLMWLALAPAQRLPGFCLQVASIAAALLALAEVGIWLLPPWWAPYVFGILWIATTIIGSRRRKQRVSPKPMSLKTWSSLAVSAVLLATATAALWDAYKGSKDSARVVALASPVRGVSFFITSGGSTELINAHVETLAPAQERMLDYRGQSYGVDIVKLGPFGLRSAGLRPRDPTAYAIFGEPIYAPCAGVVVQIANDRPDLPVPEADRDHMAGNHVLLQCGDVQVLLAHMRRGSVTAIPGQTIALGMRIGAVGNSGNTGEPHLHVHAQGPGSQHAPFSGTPYQMRIDGAFLLRNDRFSSHKRLQD